MLINARMWRVVGRRYFLISIIYVLSEVERRAQVTAWVSDLSLRPIFAVRIASVRGGLLKCENFVAICTSVPNPHYDTDISDTDEWRTYPLPNDPPWLDFIAFLRTSLIMGLKGNSRFRDNIHFVRERLIIDTRQADKVNTASSAGNSCYR